MLISEIKGWHWAITYDNPMPANSTALLAALKKLGRLTAVQTKTTYLLAPKKQVNWRQIRAAITMHMHHTRGNIFYVNLRSGGAFEWGKNTQFKWRRLN